MSNQQVQAEAPNMLTLEGIIVVDSQRQAVLDFLSNPANIAKLPGSGEIAEWTSDPPHGIGSTMRFEARMMGLVLHTKGEVTVWDPPDQYARKAISGPLAAEFTFTLEEKQDATQLTVEGELEFKGILRLIERPFHKVIQKRFEEDLTALEQLMDDGSEGEI